jgi:tRNA G10  N-methylase Trm11
MSSLNYLTILGRQPELGLVELESLLGADGVQPFGRQAALVERALEVDRLGGAVKVGEVLYRGPVTGLRELPMDVSALPMRETKTPFAVSVYGGTETPRSAMAAGLELKKRLRARGSVRLVTAAKGLAVTAAELRHNRVLDDGFELLVVIARSEMVVARTLGVQDINWYSKRDYERPARSAVVGMLPPKLAQILVNTTTAPTVADPFCGTGVVLQEALLLGRAAWGADVAPEMVAATRENLAWLAGVATEHGVPTPLLAWTVVEPADARQVRLPAEAAVVSEGYLGPNMSASPTPVQLAEVRRELLGLYRESLRNFARQLPTGGEVSITVPAWRVGKLWHYLGLVDELSDLGYTLKGFKHTATPLLYAREDQVVGRQLLLLRKN